MARSVGLVVFSIILLAGCQAAPTEIPPPTDTPPPPTATALPTVASPADAQLSDTWSRPADGMQMIYIPAGRFVMGSTEADPCAHLDEFPRHTVSLDAYWIDRTEVTNAQYQACVETGICQPATSCSWGEPTYENPAKADHPVVCVNWFSAGDYCAWVGGRLPTEAEWEYAARGADERRYPWGDEFDSELCNSSEAGIDETTPAGQFSPLGDSPFGLVDVAGNVWEWVTDWYEIGSYTHDKPSNPTGPKTGKGRALRGGSWYGDGCSVRTTYRYYNDPLDHSPGVGFRCVVAAVD